MRPPRWQVRTLELLKLRFGEGVMHQCDVMLKDLADSKRVDANIKADAALAAGLEHTSATILSALFWPPLGAEAGVDFALPAEVEARLATYWQRFHTIKAPRKLVWKKGLGSVRLHLTLAGARREFCVSPLHASIMLRFDGADRWELEALAEAMSLAPAVLRRKMRMWVNAGVLLEQQAADGSVAYSVVEALFSADEEGEMGAPPAVDEERESAVATAEEQEAAGMRVYEQYVLGMLTNFDSLPLERIHNMLKMFVAEPPYDKSAQQARPHRRVLWPPYVRRTDPGDAMAGRSRALSPLLHAGVSRCWCCGRRERAESAMSARCGRSWRVFWAAWWRRRSSASTAPCIAAGNKQHDTGGRGREPGATRRRGGRTQEGGKQRAGAVPSGRIHITSLLAAGGCRTQARLLFCSMERTLIKGPGFETQPFHSLVVFSHHGVLASSGTALHRHHTEKAGVCGVLCTTAYDGTSKVSPHPLAALHP